MRPTFEEALNELFGAGTGRTLAVSQNPETTTEQPAAQTPADLAAEADLQFQQVRESLKNWDWTTAGEAMNKLEQSILELKKTLEK